MRFVDRPSRLGPARPRRCPRRWAGCITGSYTGALTGLLWGGLVRVFLLHHVTWSINSVCHFFGRRRFETEDKSTNVWWLALPTLRRGVAPQPPRLPALGHARPGPARARPVGGGDLGDGEAGPGLGRGEDHARAPDPAHGARRARAPRAPSCASRRDAGGLVVLALAEATLLVLLGILLGKLLLALAEAAVVLLLGIHVGQVLLALAEAADLLVLGEDLGRGFALGEAVVGLLG